MRAIPWQPIPTAGPSEARYPVISPKPNAPITCLLLTESVQGVETHFLTRTQPCYDASTCTHCFAGLPRRWKGFIPVLTLPNDTRAILELPQAASQRLRDFSATGKILTGNLVRVSRAGKARNSAVKIELIDLRTPEGAKQWTWLFPRHSWPLKTVVPHDMDATLRALWADGPYPLATPATSR